MSAAENPSNGIDKDGKSEKSKSSTDYTIAKAAGAVIASGIAWTVFKTFWPKKADEETEYVSERASGLEADAKEGAERFVDKANAAGHSIAKRFPKFPRKAKFGQEYEVCYGDTLYGLSRKYEVSIEALKAANGLASDFIVEGDKLNIPG